MKQQRGIKLFSILTAVMLAASPAARADEESLTQMVKDLQKQMANMQSTIDQQNHKIRQLENRPMSVTQTVEPAAQNSAPVAMTDSDFTGLLNTTTGGADKWLKDLKFKGDLRLRYEGAHHSKGNPAHSGNLNRFRFRLRYGFEKLFGPEMKIGFRLASGSTGDPTSTNQTFTGNFVDKTHVIDQAYAIYTPNWGKIGPIQKLELGGGKFNNPFTRGSSDLIWDGDVNPEGAYEMIDATFVDTEDFALKGFLTMGQMILQQAAHTAANQNSELYAFQLGVNPEVKVGDMPLKFLSAASYYNYSDFAHGGNFGALAGGNPNVDTEAGTLDANQFKVLDFMQSVELKPVDFLPVMKPWFEYAFNTDANTKIDASAAGENTAWGAGLKLGKTKAKGDWELSYAYKFIQANSVVGAFNDSDFGHSGRRGNVISFQYKLTDNLTTGITAFLVNNLNHDTLTRDQEEKRAFADLVWSF